MRFTLAACLALTAAIAVLCYLLTAQPSGISYLLLMSILIFAPICAVAGMVYGRDNLRAFSIGAAFPLALLVWSSSGHFQAISFDPAAYGWATQGQTGGQAVTPSFTFNIPAVSGTPIVNSGPTPWLSGGAYPVIISQPATASAYSATVSKAALMTNPTCALGIAAILGGVLVMALRGVLNRKDSTTHGNTGG